MSDFDLKTDEGELHMEPPGKWETVFILITAFYFISIGANTEHYSDDFESYDPGGEVKPQKEDGPDITVSVSTSSSIEDVFSVSFEDISALRESLESDAAITRSMVSLCTIYQNYEYCKNCNIFTFFSRCLSFLHF